MDAFSYMPRVTILPGKYEEERISVLTEYCRRYRYDEVMFFINGENLNDGHIDLNLLPKYVDCIKRAKQQLAKSNIKTSLNPWNTLLGSERGCLLHDGQNFKLMVDIDGKSAKAIPCPLCENWREHFAEYYSYLVREVNPNIIWIEDDFRLHNHSPLNWGGCFCASHMELYSNYIGRKVTQQEMVSGLTKRDDSNIFRKAYYFVNRKIMNELALFIGEALRKINPLQKVALMSSDPKMHSIEGRDWCGILSGLSGNNTPIDRIHLPSYRQDSGQNYCWSMNDISLNTRALLPENTCVLPEVENAMFSPYTKSRNFTRFQIESSMCLCPQGITLDLDCFSGNGIVFEYKYGEKNAEIKNYMNAFKNLNIDFKNMCGIVIPASEDAFLRSENAPSIKEININENWWASQLASMSVAFRYRKERSYCGEVVAISGSYLRSLTDDEILRLFADNTVLIEGNCVKILFERGLNNIINAESFSECNSENGDCSFEEAAEGKKYLKIFGARTSATVTCPKFLNIKYSLSGVQTYTTMYNYKQEQVGIAECRVKNCFVLPYLCYSKHHGLHTTMREQILKEFLSYAVSRKTKIIYNDNPYLSTYFFNAKDCDYLMLINFCDDDYETSTISGLEKYKSIERLSRISGKFKRVKFKKIGNKIILHDKIQATTTCLLRLKR